MYTYIHTYIHRNIDTQIHSPKFSPTKELFFSKYLKNSPKNSLAWFLQVALRLTCPMISWVCMGPGNPGKSWNFTLAFSRTGKSRKMTTSPGKSWRSVRSALTIAFSQSHLCVARHVKLFQRTKSLLL